jgi:hypothetical protein
MAGDISQQVIFLLRSDCLRSVARKSRPDVWHFLYLRALIVKSTHWISDTCHFAGNLIAELAAAEPSVERAIQLVDPLDAKNARRREAWERIIGRSPGVLPPSRCPLIRSATY